MNQMSDVKKTLKNENIKITDDIISQLMYLYLH